ncbi:hypothetical protein BDU57DRAFT_157386 [Ampelomyces quisqualis]|uniref:Uncharacterized protein n=1 Tax=Ampelomyces quisqualis TaxID=50730 RepID=A0A6A5QYQ6_AMPQU|nr:hypothetical protein BDU57DRAFT_157386 [Ampelomyces quisqualis]
MSVAQVEQRIRENHDGQHLLDALPPYDSLEWTPFEAHPLAHVPMGLVLATVDNRDIVAFFTQSGDKAPEIRYCSKPKERLWSAASIIALSQGYLNILELRPPFKYIAGTAKTDKRKFSYIVKWYFMTKGLLDSAIAGNLADWCKVFYKALQAVESQMPRQDGRSTRSEARGEYDAVQESPEAAGNGSTNDLRSARRNAQDESVSTLAAASHNKRQALQTPEGSIMSDCDTLCKLLAQENYTHLLKNISEWKKLDWYEGRITPDSLPYRLLVGKTSRDSINIYAHLKAVNDTYMVQYWFMPRRGKASGVALPSKDLAAQNVIHPFDKTYDRTCDSLSKSEEERLEILVKWYFVASGKINNLLEYEPNYAARFLDTLNYITNRINHRAQPIRKSNFMPGVSNRPSSSSPSSKNSVQSNSLRSPRISPRIASTFTFPKALALAVQNRRSTTPQDFESQAAQDLCTATPQTPGQVVPRAEPRASRTPQRALPSPATRGTKRTADDACLTSVTAELNELDEQLEFHEFAKDGFLEQEALDTQNLKVKQSEEEKRFREDMEARLENFMEEQHAEARKWLEDQRAKSQKFMDGWQRKHDELTKVREQVAERRKRMRLEKYRTLNGVGFKNQ